MMSLLSRSQSTNLMRVNPRGTRILKHENSSHCAGVKVVSPVLQANKMLCCVVVFASIIPAFREIKHEPRSQMVISFTAEHDVLTLDKTLHFLEPWFPGVEIGVTRELILTPLVCSEANNYCYKWHLWSVRASTLIPKFLWSQNLA